MRKIIGILLFFFLLLHPQKIFAKDPNFDISVNSNYEIGKDGVATLTQNISIKNRTEFYYTPTYSISVGFKDIQNIVAYGADGPIPFSLDDSDKQNKSIKLKFEKRYAGLDTTNNFTLRLETKDIVSKKGNLWEVTIPGISSPDDFSSYDTIIHTPIEFGFPKIVKPKKNNLDTQTLKFSKDEIGKAGALLIYGDKQYYHFELSYHISNPNLFPVKTEIALPPNTNYQNVILTSFSEKPSKVTLDHDQNWIAEYPLFPQQKMDIIVKGYVEMNSNPLSESETPEKLKSYLLPKKYWEVSNKKIQQIASNLKDAQDVYDYVTTNLNYNFDKVTGDNKRLGAIGAINNPDNSVCLEFTDLFVTLARASGIPARAVEGYAYTENSTLRPLSLLEDVLHSWPEYYDTKSQKWIMVDPTWGNTTKGMDYFNSLDFEHVAFVIKGQDSEYPIPAGGYKFDQDSKDVTVNFAKSNNFIKNEDLEITDDFPKFVFPGFEIEGNFIIKNIGDSLTANKTAIITDFNGKKSEYEIDNLPPGGNTIINLKYKNLPFLTNGVKTITIQVDKFSYTKKITISFIPDLSIILLFGGIIGGAITITVITYYTGSILIQRRKR